MLKRKFVSTKDKKVTKGGGGGCYIVKSSY